jgi:hypothetical protein
VTTSRKLSRSGAAKLAAAAVSGLVLVGAASAGSNVGPVLKLGANSNAVRGSHFKAHELVRVVFVADVAQTRLVRTSAVGSFAALLPAPSDSCAPLLIRAIGSSGDAAAFRLPHGLCAPPSAGPQTPDTGLPPNADGIASRNPG